MRIPGAGVMHLHLAVGTGPRLLSSTLLFTFECLIGKAMSPRCECVTVTGVGTASCTGEKERQVGQQQGWGGPEPDMRRRATRRVPCTQPPGTGTGQLGTFHQERRRLQDKDALCLHLANCAGTSNNSSPADQKKGWIGRKESQLHPGPPFFTCSPGLHGQVGQARGLPALTSQNNCPSSGLLGPSCDLYRREHFIPVIVWVRAASGLLSWFPFLQGYRSHSQCMKSPWQGT